MWMNGEVTSVGMNIVLFQMKRCLEIGMLQESEFKSKEIV